MCPEVSLYQYVHQDALLSSEHMCLRVLVLMKDSEDFYYKQWAWFNFSLCDVVREKRPYWYKKEYLLFFQNTEESILAVSIEWSIIFNYNKLHDCWTRRPKKFMVHTNMLLEIISYEQFAHTVFFNRILSLENRHYVFLFVPLSVCLIFIDDNII